MKGLKEMWLYALDVKNRTRRRDYITGMLMSYGIVCIVTGLMLMLTSKAGTGQALVGLLSGVLSIATAVATFTMFIRRAHDIGKSGKTSFLLCLVTCGIYSWIIMFTPGQSGENQYGENPKEIDPEPTNTLMDIVLPILVYVIGFVFVGAAYSSLVTNVLSSSMLPGYNIYGGY